jgi:hypothetical protein
VSDIKVGRRRSTTSTCCTASRSISRPTRTSRHAVTATPQTLARDGFGKDPQFAALIAERAASRSASRSTPSTTRSGRGARHLHRGHLGGARGAPRRRCARADGGAGAECRAKGYKRIDLNVLDWNPARAFYERIGFRWIRNWLP